MVEFKVIKGSSTGALVDAVSSREIKPDEVLIDVTHSGVCFTDYHYRQADMALGHEGSGVVKQIGSDVTRYRVGDRVGWGYQHNSCGHCKQCLTGRETFCAEREMFGLANFDQGSFASAAVWKEDFIYKIPDNISSSHAGPLMCGGSTVFNALKLNNVRSTDRVGVIGVGGLGHLAIQFASQMGCEVVVFSSTEQKRAEALAFGASEFYPTKGVEKLEIRAPIDHLLVTSNAQPDWGLYLPIMAPEGTIYPITVSFEKLAVPAMDLIMGGLRIQGGMIAPRQIHREMLEFASRHNIVPVVEEFPLTAAGATEALQRLLDGKMRYRGVLVAQK
ncbi:GroES-like protein [Trichoderma sp. TUCIM 5745]